jgi:hypothetical protein
MPERREGERVFFHKHQFFLDLITPPPPIFSFPFLFIRVEL